MELSGTWYFGTSKIQLLVVGPSPRCTSQSHQELCGLTHHCLSTSTSTITSVTNNIKINIEIKTSVNMDNGHLSQVTINQCYPPWTTSQIDKKKRNKHNKRMLKKTFAGRVAIVSSSTLPTKSKGNPCWTKRTKFSYLKVISIYPFSHQNIARKSQTHSCKNLSW